MQLFLHPPHRLPYCPLRLDGMEPALQRLHRALEQGETPGGKPETVGIVGDFDVDGITGAAVLVEGLSDFGLTTIPYLPDRIAEGHGLSTTAVNYLAERGATLIITVDCGVSSGAEADLAQSLGMDVIITDHHAPPPEIPKAVAIINPRIPGSEYPFPHLCGAGLAFKLMQGLYQRRGQPVPRRLLELAALGTIADVVPLQDENRWLVREGLTELTQTGRPGLQQMYRICGLSDQTVNAEAVAFQIAPRLNSAGRMGHAADSLKLLITQDSEEADRLARQLESQNRQRQLLTRQVFAAACRQVEAMEETTPFIFIEDPALTPGIAGLAAGRLAELFRRPAVALAALDKDRCIASGRSIPAFNLIEAFHSCADLFIRYGGHAQAAGFTIQRENVPALTDRLSRIVLDRLDGADLEPTLEIDAEINLSTISGEFIEQLEELEPFGEGHRKPIFLTRGLTVKRSRRMGGAGQHLKLLVADSKRTMPALAFNRAADWPEDTLEVDLVYTLTRDCWRGREEIKLVVEDLKPYRRR